MPKTILVLGATGNQGIVDPRTIPAFRTEELSVTEYRRLCCKTIATTPERVQSPCCYAKSRFRCVEEARGAWSRGRARRLDGCFDIGHSVPGLLGGVCRDELL